MKVEDESPNAERVPWVEVVRRHWRPADVWFTGGHHLQDLGDCSSTEVEDSSEVAATMTEDEDHSDLEEGRFNPSRMPDLSLLLEMEVSISNTPHASASTGVSLPVMSPTSTLGEVCSSICYSLDHDGGDLGGPGGPLRFPSSDGR
ncbi:hypothetical protein Dimus_031377 [Dionaea muscipula]